MLRFSVILPVYNGSEFIGETIRSVLNQSFQDFELLVIDDGSTDGTKEIVNQFCKADQRLSYYYKDHSGLSESLNYGLQISKGEFLTRIDADDRWLPDKLLVQDRIINENPDVRIFGSSVIFINPKGDQIPSLSGFNYGMSIEPAELRDKMLRNNVFCSSTIAFHSTLIQEVGDFDKNLQTSMDYDFLIRALVFTEGMIIKEALVEYRISKNMMTLKKRGIMINESIRIRLKALKIYTPSLFIQILVIKDIVDLYTGKLLYRINGRSHLSRYLD